MDDNLKIHWKKQNDLKNNSSKFRPYSRGGDLQSAMKEKDTFLAFFWCHDFYSNEHAHIETVAGCPPTAPSPLKGSIRLGWVRLS